MSTNKDNSSLLSVLEQLVFKNKKDKSSFESYLKHFQYVDYLEKCYNNTLIFSTYGEEQLLKKSFTITDYLGCEHTLKASENLSNITDSFKTKNIADLTIDGNSIMVYIPFDSDKEKPGYYNCVFLPEKFYGNKYIDFGETTLINNRVLKSLNYNKFCYLYNSNRRTLDTTPLQLIMYNDIILCIKEWLNNDYSAKKDNELKDKYHLQNDIKGKYNIVIDKDLKEKYKTAEELLHAVNEACDDDSALETIFDDYMGPIMEQVRNALTEHNCKYKYKIHPKFGMFDIWCV